jgi:hypothetical protein
LKDVEQTQIDGIEGGSVHSVHYTDYYETYALNTSSKANENTMRGRNRVD